MIQLMVQPSHFMSSGIKLNKSGDLYLFRFTDELQNRLENLLEKKKADVLTEEEQTELAGISELSRIFTLINAQLAMMKSMMISLFKNHDNYGCKAVGIPHNLIH